MSFWSRKCRRIREISDGPVWQRDSRLHLIEPLGFQLNEKMLRRAGLDYWDSLDVTCI